METVWVLSCVNNLIGTSDIVLFRLPPNDYEVMEFVGNMEEFLSYKEVQEKSATLISQGSLSTVCRFYELNKMGVR